LYIYTSATLLFKINLKLYSWFISSSSNLISIVASLSDIGVAIKLYWFFTIVISLSYITLLEFLSSKLVIASLKLLIELFNLLIDVFIWFTEAFNKITESFNILFCVNNFFIDVSCCYVDTFKFCITAFCCWLTYLIFSIDALQFSTSAITLFNDALQFCISSINSSIDESLIDTASNAYSTVIYLLFLSFL